MKMIKFIYLGFVVAIIYFFYNANITCQNSYFKVENYDSFATALILTGSFIVIWYNVSKGVKK